VYCPGLPDEERAHDRHCAAHTLMHVSFAGWKGERVVAAYPQLRKGARIVQVAAADLRGGRGLTPATAAAGGPTSAGKADAGVAAAGAAASAATVGSGISSASGRDAKIAEISAVLARELGEDSCPFRYAAARAATAYRERDAGGVAADHAAAVAQPAVGPRDVQRFIYVVDGRVAGVLVTERIEEAYPLTRLRDEGQEQQGVVGDGGGECSRAGTPDDTAEDEGRAAALMPDATAQDEGRAVALMPQVNEPIEPATATDPTPTYVAAPEHACPQAVDAADVAMSACSERVVPHDSEAEITAAAPAAIKDAFGARLPVFPLFARRQAIASAPRAPNECDGGLAAAAGAAPLARPALARTSLLRAGDHWAMDLRRPAQATLGVAQVWVHPEYRRRGVARALLDAARTCAVYAYVVPAREVAFSNPTGDGQALAAAYCGGAGWLVY
jgi:GNAT superfamily N-acetyltransferase